MTDTAKLLLFCLIYMVLCSCQRAPEAPEGVVPSQWAPADTVRWSMWSYGDSTGAQDTVSVDWEAR